MNAWMSKAILLLAGPVLLLSAYVGLGSFGLQPFAQANAAAPANPHDMQALCTQHMKNMKHMRDMDHMAEMMRHRMPPGMMVR
jgi:hypothetical protein